MMRRFPSALLIAIGALLCALATGAAAQPESAAQTFDRGQFRVLGYGDDFFRGLKYEPARGSLVELAFRPDRRSRLYEMPEGNVLRVFAEVADERGRVARVPLAEASIPDGCVLALVIFLADPAASGAGAGERRAYRALVFDESPSAFGAGDARFFNLTGAPLQARVGDTEFVLEPFAAPVFRFGDSAERLFPFALQVGEGDLARTVCSTRLETDARRPLLYVIKPPVRPDRLRVRLERLW